MQPYLNVLLGLVSAAVVGLASWVYATTNRLTASEVRAAAMAAEIHEIHEDVRELRRVFIGK